MRYQLESTKLESLNSIKKKYGEADVYFSLLRIFFFDSTSTIIGLYTTSNTDMMAFSALPSYWNRATSSSKY